MDISNERLQYLKLLKHKYPTERDAAAEMIRLRAVMRLPKGTEHFLSDIHGEHAAFLHILRNASGVIKEKINDLYRDVLPSHERDMLCTLVYYPEEKLALLKRQGMVNREWYRIAILRMVDVARIIAVKYTRAHVRAAMPGDLGELLEELLLREDVHDKQEYYSEMVESIVECNQADAVIIELSRIIQYLAIDRLHIIGDIYDRGPRADLIMDALEHHHGVDIQWGNHDIVWMGAASGSRVCMAQVLVTQVKYGNVTSLRRVTAYLCARCLHLRTRYMRATHAWAFCPGRSSRTATARTTWSWRECTRRRRCCCSSWKGSCLNAIPNTAWTVGCC